MNCAICGNKMRTWNQYRVYYEGVAEICGDCYRSNENWADLIYCDNCGSPMPEGDHFYIDQEYDPDGMHEGRYYCSDCYDAIVSISKRESSQDYFIDA